MTLPSNLERRCRLLAAQAVTDRLDPASAVRLACDLLVAGVESTTIVTLAGVSLHEPTAADTGPLVEALLDELEIRPDAQQAAVILLIDSASRHVAGELTTYEFGSQFWGLWTDTGHDPRFTDIGQALDEWERSVGERRADLARTLRNTANRVSSLNL